MASFLGEDLHSSDSEDVDYVPDPGEVSSEDEKDPSPPDDEIKTNRKAKNNDISDFGSEKEKTSQESASIETKDYEKQRANDLFKSFLEEVEAEMKAKESSPENAFDSSGVSCESSIKSNENSGTAQGNRPEKSSCELFDFAGEIVSVTTENGTKVTTSDNGNPVGEVEKNESINFEKSASDKPVSQPPAPKRKGLQSVLSAIMNKKQKLTTLQKTSLDWNSYKKEHDISEELETYNKGKGGFVERQRFLQRSDVRSYEIERDLRLSKKKKNC